MVWLGSLDIVDVVVEKRGHEANRTEWWSTLWCCCTGHFIYNRSYIPAVVSFRNNPGIARNVGFPSIEAGSTAFILYIMEESHFTCYIRSTRYIPYVFEGNALNNK